MEDYFSGTTAEDFTPEHYRAIGEFVTKYSILESFFHDVFRLYSAMEPDISRAVIGGMRMKDVVERTKRLAKVRALDPRILKDIEQIETLIDPLSTFRDKVIHRVWLQSGKGPVVMNLSGAKSVSGITQEPISTDDLNQKIREVTQVCLRVMAHALTDVQWLAIPSEYRNMMHAPWRDISA